MRILYAYCQELGEVVNINTARRNFACEEPLLLRYHFFCDDPHCALPKVRISGVNYQAPAAESPKFVTAHFRTWDKHHSECQWQVDPDGVALLPGETEDEAKQRQLRRKLSDLVNVFDPTLDDDDEVGRLVRVRDNPIALLDLERIHPRTRNRDIANHGVGGETRTNQLDRLVETYREAKDKLSSDDFRALEIRIVREGTLKLNEYFCHISNTSYETRDRVIYGGATLLEPRYGSGFKFKFYDKVANTTVFLYISKDKMANYRFRKYINLTLSKAEDVKYFTVYVLGRLVAGRTQGNTDLVVEDLRHLAIVLGPEKSAD